MMWVLVLLGVAIVAAVVVTRQREEARRLSAAAEALATVSRPAEEDVTRFGEELQELHIDTLTTTLDPAMRQDYQRALDCYESAKALLASASRPEDIAEVTKSLEDGRYAQACVLARQDGRALPQRRPPCFFNPRHGPAATDVAWAPPGGVRREVPVCLADADRVAAGAEPDTRQVRAGNRMVPWYQGGPAYGAYAGGYYGGYALNGLFPGILIGSMMAGMWGPAEFSAAGADDLSGGEDWSGSTDPGSGDSGGDWGGGDSGSDSGGGWDGGSGDFGGGGFDFGGF